MQTQLELWAVFPLKLPRQELNRPRTFRPSRKATVAANSKLQSNPIFNLKKLGSPIKILVALPILDTRRGIHTCLAQPLPNVTANGPIGAQDVAKQLHRPGACKTPLSHCLVLAKRLPLVSYLLGLLHKSCRIATFVRTRIPPS